MADISRFLKQASAAPINPVPVIAIIPRPWDRPRPDIAARTATPMMTSGDASVTEDDFDALPDQMRDAKRWLVWRMEKNTDPTKKPRKVPYYATGVKRHGKMDTPEDVAQFATFDEALRAFKSGGFTGLGFALGPDGTGNCWQGIDFDDMPNRPALGDIADDLPGYTETSPSGNGMHAIGYGRSFASMGSNTTGIEAYAHGRFFTVTGAGAGIHPPTCLADFVETRLRPMHGRRSDAAPADQGQAPCEVVSPQTVTELRSALLHMRADDRELWVKVGHALKTLGDVGRGLFMEWSATSLQKFDPQDAAAKWDTFTPVHTHWRAVFNEAQALGWVNPASNAASLPTAGAAVIKQSGFVFVQARDLLSKPDPVRYLIDGMIERGSLSTLFGASGSGKSFMAIDWACCIATGGEWNGKATESGAVFYIAGEGHAGIRRRLKAWEIHTGTPLQAAPLFVSTSPAALMDSGNAMSVANAVDALAAEHGTPSLIVVDTLARNLGNGEENSNADIGLFINNIDVLLRTRFGATILIVHHTGWAEKERARGGSALRAAMDSEYRLDLAKDIRTLVCTKVKESEPLAPMNFTLQQIVLDGWANADGELMTSAVLISSSETSKVKDKDAALKGANRVALDSLAHALQADGEPPAEPLRAAMGILAPQKVVSESVWRKRAYAEGISDGEPDAKKAAFRRSRKVLLDMEKISTWEDVYWLGGVRPEGVKVGEIEDQRDTGQGGTKRDICPGSITLDGTDRDTHL